MSGSIKLGLFIILAVFAAFLVVKVVYAVVAGILHVLFPIAIIGGLGWVLYRVFAQKSLGGRNGRSLP